MGKERFLKLATVRKTFGKGGELLLKIHPDVSQNIIDQLNKEEPVFIQVDGIPVPFYFTFLQLKGNDKAIVCFENYLDERLAEEWVGHTILFKMQDEKSPYGGLDFVGYSFTAITPSHKSLRGTVSGFYDYPGNPCLELEFEDGTRTLLPFHENFIRRIRHSGKYMELGLPEGL
jgi:16S rRNA processing protein RimM